MAYGVYIVTHTTTHPPLPIHAHQSQACFPPGMMRLYTHTGSKPIQPDVKLDTYPSASTVQATVYNPHSTPIGSRPVQPVYIIQPPLAANRFNSTRSRIHTYWPPLSLLPEKNQLCHLCLIYYFKYRDFNNI